MQRDLAMVVKRGTTYESIEQTVKKVKLGKAERHAFVRCI
jgi:hypothetical protein